MMWIGWLLLAACFHMAYVLRLSAGILAVPLCSEFALSASAFGAMSSMVFYAYTLMQIPVGILADTRGPRFTVSAGMLIAGAGSLIFASATSQAWLFLGRALMGIGVAGAFVCTMKFLSENFSGGQFATLSGITSFIGNAGGMTAQAPLALLVAFFSWRHAFAFLGGIAVLLAVLCLLVLSSPVRRPFSAESLREGMRGILSKAGMYSVSLNYMASQACFLAMSGTWGVSYLKAVHGVDGASFMTLMAAGIMAGAVAAGRISDLWRSRKKPLCFFAFVHVCLWAALVFLPSIQGPLSLSLLLFGLGFFAGALVIPWSMAREMNPAEHTGLSIAVMNTVAFLAVAVLTSVMGSVLDGAALLPPGEAWRNVMLLPLGTAGAGLAGAVFAPETFGGNGVVFLREEPAGKGKIK